MPGAEKKRKRRENKRTQLEDSRKELAKWQQKCHRLEHELTEAKLDSEELAKSQEKCCSLQLDLNEAETDLIEARTELQEKTEQIQKAQEYLDADSRFLQGLLDSEVQWCLQQTKARLDKFQEEKDKRLDRRDLEQQMQEDSYIENFICGMTKQFMQDPVVAEDEKVYERSAIQNWLKTNDTSPTTGNPMGKQLLAVPNLKKMIQQNTMQIRKNRNTNLLHENHNDMPTELFKIPDGIPDLRCFDNIPRTPPGSPEYSSDSSADGR